MKITQRELKDQLRYNPETGEFTWVKVARFSKMLGKIAGCNNGRNTSVIWIAGRRYGIHELAFLYMEGYIPKLGVRFLDGDKRNTVWSNLQERVSVCSKERNITQKRLKELLHYNPETGMFTWRNSMCNNTIKAGSIAGYFPPGDYVAIKLDGAKYSGHALAWLYVKGKFPNSLLDHKNRIRNDNRFCNIRLATFSRNARNTKLSRRNKSGVKGVGWDYWHEKWYASIYVGKLKHLGYFKYKKDAVVARLEAEQKLNWGADDSNSPAFQYVQKMLGR